MVRTKYVYRLWCSNCQDYKIHERTNVNEKTVYTCECGCELSDVSLKDIPQEKVLEQRERFKRKRKCDFSKTLTNYLLPKYDNFFSEVTINTEVIESDAGLIAIEKAEREKQEQLRTNAVERILKYKGLQRNDICICGSDKKYKKCCLIENEKLMYIYNL